MSGSCDTTIKTLSSHNLSKFSTKVHNTDRVCFGIVAGVGFFFYSPALEFPHQASHSKPKECGFSKEPKAAARQKAKNSSEEFEVKYNFNRFDSALNKLAFISHAKIKTPRCHPLKISILTVTPRSANPSTAFQPKVQPLGSLQGF